MKHRAVALIGLVLLVPIALGLVRGSISLEEAGIRALVLIVGLSLVERLVLPLAKLAVGDPKRADGRRR